MRALSHPNIIKLYEVYETKSSFYIVMEVLTGGNLNDFIKNKYVFKPDEIRIIIKTLLKTLQYIHSKNIMHRDIKPENILLRKANIEEKNICFADFGLSTFTNVPEFIYYKCGTPGFVAPEILKLTKTDEKKYGVSCDIFSLGVVFHILFKFLYFIVKT